jgi:hypothetical protein
VIHLGWSGRVPVSALWGTAIAAGTFFIVCLDLLPAASGRSLPCLHSLPTRWQLQAHFSVERCAAAACLQAVAELGSDKLKIRYRSYG